MNNNLKALSFINLAFNDYIAARYLIHGDYILQGVILASSAVEKYLKVILVLFGKNPGVHLNKIDELKKALSECYCDVTQKIDERFLKILGDVYWLRYYDRIKDSISVGFFINQFIGELDTTVNFMETEVIKNICDTKGNIIKTAYHRNIEENNKDLFLNNYILNNLSKRDHMEKEDNGFYISVGFNNTIQGSILGKAQNIRNKYDDGRMTLINIQ